MSTGSIERSTEIGADADQLSVSRSASNSQSVVGLGTISGRAILAVGELALRGIETVNITVTLQRITSRLRGHGSVLREDVLDLLELQRIGLYPKFVRRKAWALLYTLLGREDTEHIIPILLSWAAVEVQLFLRQLVSYQLTAWSSMPKGLSSTAKPGTTMRVSNSICCLFLAILNHDAYIVHEIYDLYKFARLLSPLKTVPIDRQNQKTRNSLTRFFDSWIYQCATQEDDSHIFLPARCMIQYLVSGNDTHMQVVVDHIKVAVFPFAYLPDDEDEDTATGMRRRVEEVSRQYLNLGLSDVSLPHPISPFLEFVKLLCYQSKAACRLFGQAGFVDLILRLHEIKYFHISIQALHTQQFMDRLCQSILAILDPTISLSPVPILIPISRHSSWCLYPSQSTSRPHSESPSATIRVRQQSSSDSLSSLRAVFRLKMPPPPPPPSPTLPKAPPPSPSMSFYNLSGGSEETLSARAGPASDDPPHNDHAELHLFSPLELDEDGWRYSLRTLDDAVSLDSSPSDFYAFAPARTDCATVGVKTLSSRFPSRRSTWHTVSGPRQTSPPDTPSHSRTRSAASLSEFSAGDLSTLHFTSDLSEMLGGDFAADLDAPCLDEAQARLPKTQDAANRLPRTLTRMVSVSVDHPLPPLPRDTLYSDNATNGHSDTPDIRHSLISDNHSNSNLDSHSRSFREEDDKEFGYLDAESYVHFDGTEIGLLVGLGDDYEQMWGKGQEREGGPSGRRRRIGRKLVGALRSFKGRM
ncbi:hypothetical protein BXZ70DRAFT_437322 [Cristinia sonorae]|uniref:Uncharacterized protein n=1 Tax=Cristinia sonorae TaxID=1940300 RepID=A0A8K0UK89_9AGAR|nr:hypothetical protein BXZ70DRAFT_437322 [Cristinia sonorae]